MNHPSRNYVSLLRQARYALADNSTALTYCDLSGDARRLADAQLERNAELMAKIGHALAKDPLV